eukprot:365643-Chlamydomonas_euryale.AAC.4
MRGCTPGEEPGHQGRFRRSAAAYIAMGQVGQEEVKKPASTCLAMEGGKQGEVKRPASTCIACIRQRGTRGGEETHVAPRGAGIRAPAGL